MRDRTETAKQLRSRKLMASQSLRAVSARHCAHVLAVSKNKEHACQLLGISFRALCDHLLDYAELTKSQACLDGANAERAVSSAASEAP